MLPLASDSLSTILTVLGPLLGVLVGGSVTYYTQTKLEDRREERERQADEDRQERRRRELSIAAYANAWSIKAEVGQRTAYARSWVGNEIALENLAVVKSPMETWQTKRTLFADALCPLEWLALVKAVEIFNDEWGQFLTVARREGPLSPTEHRALLNDLENSSNRLFSRESDVDAAMRPLFELGNVAESIAWDERPNTPPPSARI